MKTINNKFNQKLKRVASKITRYFFFLSLLFLVSCLDASDILSDVFNLGDLEDNVTITASDFTVSTTSVIKEVGYTDPDYGKVELKSGIVAAFAIVNSNVPNNAVAVNPLNGEIKVAPGVGIGDYTFQVKVTGVDLPSGSAKTKNLGLTIADESIEKIEITEDDFTVVKIKVNEAVAYASSFNYGRVELTNEVTASFAIVNSTTPNNEVTIDENGAITVAPGLPVGKYTFQVEVNGAEKYFGTMNTVELPLAITIPITEDDFTISEKIVVREDGYMNTSYGNVTMNNEVTATFAIVDNGALPSDAVIVDENGTITMVTGVSPGTYLFQVEVAGSGDYSGSITSDLVFNVIPPTAELNNVFNLDNNKEVKLNGANKVVTAKVGEEVYLFVTAFESHAVNSFRVEDNGELNIVTSIVDDESLALKGAKGVATAEVGGTMYLFVTGFNDNGVNVFRVDDSGDLHHIESIVDDENLELRRAWGVTTAEVNGSTYLFVSGFSDNGVSVFKVNNDGKLTTVTRVKDNDNLQLAGARGITTAKVGDATYLFVAGRKDNGVSVFGVASDGMLNHITNVSNNSNIELSGPIGVTTTEIDGITYLFVAAKNDDGLSVFSVANDGMLTHVGNTSDNEVNELDGAWGVATAKVNGANYLLSTGFVDDGISIFDLNMNRKSNKLFNVANVTNEGDLELNGARGITTAEVNGVTYVFVASVNDDGISVFEIKN